MVGQAVVRPALTRSARAAIYRGGPLPQQQPGGGWRQLRQQRRHLHAAAPPTASLRPDQEQPTSTWDSSERRSRPDVYLGLPSVDDFDFTPQLARTSSSSNSSTGSSTTSGIAMPSLAALLAPAAATLAALAAVLLWLPPPADALSLQGAVGSLEQLIQQAGILGPLIFIAAYVAATVLLFPASILTLAAGFLFGPVLGTAVVSVASTAGAAAAFLVGRYLARPAVEKRIEGNSRWAAVDRAIGAQGPKIVLLLRLSPLFPFTLLNYALSLTQIEFAPFVLASWAGMLPGTVAYVALGGAGKAAAETAAGGGAGPVQLVLYGVGAAATLWATALISKAASKALEEASEAAADGGGSADGLREDE